MSEEDSKTTLSLGGGSYGLIGIGVGLSVAHLGTSIFMSIVSGMFWPATLGYWVLKALHNWAV